MRRTVYTASAAVILWLALTGAALAQVGKTEGEIRRVDPETGKVTMRHGPVTGELDMPAMTMVFQARDQHLAHHLKAGQRVDAVIVKEDGIFYLQSATPK